MSAENIVAQVGTTGGAGTTRTAVELAATLARDGRSVAIFDAAYATQGLAGYVDGKIDPAETYPRRSYSGVGRGQVTRTPSTDPSARIAASRRSAGTSVSRRSTVEPS